MIKILSTKDIVPDIYPYYQYMIISQVNTTHSKLVNLVDDHFYNIHGEVSSLSRKEFYNLNNSIQLFPHYVTEVISFLDYEYDTVTKLLIYVKEEDALLLMMKL